MPRSEITNTKIEEDIFWVCAGNLFQFDLKQANQLKQRPYNAFIRKISVNTDSTIFWGNHYQKDDAYQMLLSGKQPEALKFNLPYQDNSLTFEFASPYFNDSEKLVYSYFLEGHDEVWSKWSPDTKKEFTDLFEGQYTFRVKAKNIFGVESEPASFEFTVAPPIYRTIWAYLAYALLAGLSLAVILKLNSQRHKAENRRLEGLVNLRTEEISVQNEKLLAQNEIIESRSKKTQDSINSAERILTALHSTPDKLCGLVEQSFVFAKPRDTVSGDFFWCTEQDGKQIVVCADCTGHGIPGAFMSVIGQSLLKETVRMYGITDASEILTSLHSMLVASLEHKGGESIEGMDIGVCVIDRQASKVTFAGAKMPLVYIQEGKLAVIKGSKLPVGGIRPDEERQFVEHVIPIDTENPTSFYLFSDGFQDQFGGTSNRKYYPSRLRELLLKIHVHNVDEQRDKLAEELVEWQGNHPQIDDILVIGFRA